MAVTNDLHDFVRDSAGQAFMFVVAVVTLSVVIGLDQNRHGSLPASLNGASLETEGSKPVGDPIAGRLYPYQVAGVDTYELCRRLSTQFRRF